MANGCLFCPEDPAVRDRLTECLEAILNKAQEPPKSKKVQHSNAKNAVLFEAISLVIHHDRWACTRSASALHTQLGATLPPLLGAPLLLGVPPGHPLPGPPRHQRECVSRGLRGSRLWRGGVWRPRRVGWGCFQVPAGAPTRVPWFHGLGTVSKLPRRGVCQSWLCLKGADVMRTE